jgi:PAS domain S-box-containing protein
VTRRSNKGESAARSPREGSAAADPGSGRQLADVQRELADCRAELLEARGFLDHLLAASPAMVFRFDPDTLRLTYASPNIGWLLGYAPSEVLDGFWERTIHPDDGARLFEALRGAIGNLVAQIEQECRYRGKDGRYRWFLTLLRVEYDLDARPVSVVGYALDVGERKSAEEQVRQARAFSDSIIENLPAVVIVKDARDLRYARFNRAAEETLGISRDSVIGKTDLEIFPPALAEASGLKDRMVLQTRMAVDIPEEIVATPGGEPKVLHTKKIPVLDETGQPAHLVGVSIDITEQRAAHEQVRLAQLEAERASRAKSDFLSRMSHDLRTPLNAILGFAQILEMDALSPEQAEGVQQILRGGVHLLELINEVLDIARIEAGQLPLSPEPVPIEEVVTHVINLVRPLGRARRISVIADVAAGDGLHVHADRQRLNQVLVNLISNAVKYNREDGSVRVSCERRGPVARIRVSDTGPGIPAEKMALLFQPFERLGADQSAVEGTGLGLAVSKGLTEAMGGRIGLESQVDAGSTFWIELPITTAPATRPAAHEAPPVASPATASGTVLYIEDNRSNIRLLERLLTRRPGVRLLTASSGEAGLEMLSTAHPDLILLDLHLPDLSGEEILRRIWADPETRRIPVAVLSADATARQQQRLLAAGAVAYLTKPLDVAVLLRVVDERLGQRNGAP